MELLPIFNSIMRNRLGAVLVVTQLAVTMAVLCNAGFLAIDRLQTPIANMANGGGTWAEYDVTLDQLDQRVGRPISRGAPGLWSWLRPKLQAFFDAG